MTGHLFQNGNWFLRTGPKEFFREVRGGGCRSAGNPRVGGDRMEEVDLFLVVPKSDQVFLTKTVQGSTSPGSAP